MTLSRELEKTGVSLDKMVGFITHAISADGKCVPISAGIGYVQLELPEKVKNTPETQGYDPNHDLLITLGYGEFTQLYLLRGFGEYIIYEIENGGIILIREDMSFTISQSPCFMERAKEIRQSSAH